MPEKLYLFTDQGDIGEADDPNRIVVHDERLRLRPLDTFSETRYDRWGKRLTAITDLAEIRAEGISELFGFHAEFVENGGSVSFQVSNDGGVTFFRWTGTEWIDDGQFCTREDMDAGLPSLELPSPKRIKVRVRLEPSANGRAGPELKTVSVYYELEYQWEEDLARSLKRYLDANFNFAGITREIFDLAAADKVTIQGEVVPLPPVKAWNLDTDPKRITNLATDIVGQDIMLSSAQSGEIDVRFRARVTVFITADEALEISKVPSLVIEVQTLRENRSVRTNEPKVDWHRTEKKVRIRPPPVQENTDLRIRAQSSLEREAEAMVEALATVLQYERTFTSEATGEIFIVKGLTPIAVGDVLGDGLYVREATLSVAGRHWLTTPFKEVPIAEEVRLLTTFIQSPDRRGEESIITP